MAIRTLVFFLLFITQQAEAQLANQAAPDDATLANLYSPLLRHPQNEPNLPANVDWFLGRTTLSFHNNSCPQDNKQFGAASSQLLTTATLVSACGTHTFTASGTRSSSRSKTFVLADVSASDRRGLTRPSQWSTYYHLYKNDSGGKTIQYWSFYSYNTGKTLGPIELGFHGGDWEMVAVVLNADLVPISVATTGHSTIDSQPWSSIEKHGTHPVFYTEMGAHEAHPTPQWGISYFDHPTWKGALASYQGSVPEVVGDLVDLGTKLAPKAPFLKYSGLWGSLGATPFSSGYWGPAFNETGMGSDGLLAAWCSGIADNTQTINGKRECFPDDPQ